MKKKIFPVVGLGASAGGLEALKVFFNNVPKDSGMSYIVNVHLSAKQPSMMAELLQRVTSIPVREAENGQKLKPNCAYVVPSGKLIELQNGVITLKKITDGRPKLPIDDFLRSLARDQGCFAVAIILSGTGSDGTLGIKEIKARDGLVLVQSEESASYDGMPHSAIDTGLVDMVLAPEEMVQKLIRYFEHTEQSSLLGKTSAEQQQEWLTKIFALLRTRVGHDFSNYKVNTLLRRVSRRMGLNQIAEQGQYLEYLRQNPGEVDALFRELLIGVTNFFRDPESFEVLAKIVLPEIFKSMPEDAVFRGWIPGCSTGEEVYSLAIVIREVLGGNSKRIKVQLFGTDIDSYAIDKAREGVFPSNIASDVDEERLAKFFIKEGNFYRVRKEIRDSAIFSVQDLIRDPPFSRLHLLCCRNLLIYLDAEAQKKLLPLFHYTLNVDGVLVLGSSESIGGFSNLFDPIDKKWKIFRRREVSNSLRRQVSFPSGGTVRAPQEANGIPAAPTVPRIDIGQMTQQVILERFAPAAVLVDSKGLLLFIQGRTGKYLETPSGMPTHNILDMAREGLRIELSSSLRKAKASGRPEVRRKIAIRYNDTVQMINLHVLPLLTPKAVAGRFLVAFEDIEETGREVEELQGDELASSRLVSLEKELQSTRESHQNTIEELESSNEELKSTNEELQSANEELQSANEELESSKEELQSLNEELHTVNSELQSKVDELSAAHDDMRNLLNSIEIATIFVDHDMCIRRFTPQATSIVNLIQSDIGRPLKHVVTNLAYEHLTADLAEVLQSLSPKEVEVQSNDHHWYKMRIIPYRTTDNRIDGAVITFASIDEQKQAQRTLTANNADISEAWHLVSNVLDLTPEPLVVLDRDGRIILANTLFADLMRTDPEKVKGLDIYSIHKGILGSMGLKEKLQIAAEQNVSFQLEIEAQPLINELGACRLKGQVIRADEYIPPRLLLQFVKEP